MVKHGDDVGDNDIDEYIIVEGMSKTSLDAVAERFLGDITKASACKQLGIGGATGWVTGYLANKIGKLAAVSLAGTVLLFQIAQYNGYIKVDWPKVQRAITQAQAKARHTLQKRRNTFFQKGQRFVEENVFLASGFAAGFLVGFFW